MKQLWAPWRMDYITAAKGGECIFCLREKAAEDSGRLVVKRGVHAFLMLNRYPYSNGHLLVAPYRHLDQAGDLSVEEVLEMHQLEVLGLEALRRAMAPQGFNLGTNLGAVAGAGVADHLHRHIVPRWQGDTNFMPVLGDVRVIPQHLEETRRLLEEAIAEIDALEPLIENMPEGGEA